MIIKERLARVPWAKVGVGVAVLALVIFAVVRDKEARKLAERYDEASEYRSKYEVLQRSVDREKEFQRAEAERLASRNASQDVSDSFSLYMDDAFTQLEVEEFDATETTYLYELFAATTSVNAVTCQGISSLSRTALEDEDFVTALAEYLEVPAEKLDLSAVSGRVERVCTGVAGVYLVTLAESFREATVYDVVVEGDRAIARSYGNFEVMDGAIAFLGSLNGTAVVRTGYGDAGYLWWSFYALDAATHQHTLIEKCTLSPVYEEGVYQADAADLACDTEYRP